MDKKSRRRKMLMVGLGEAGNNIVDLFKPHTKNYKIICLDRDWETN